MLGHIASTLNWRAKVAVILLENTPFVRLVSETRITTRKGTIVKEIHAIGK